ncbi:MAG: preprotein translocase subunit SecG [Candidatus Delongbacteria bacterium]|nr:preprotein translocase subunit SecG [Candidatus Delongbacteria bacterium]
MQNLLLIIQIILGVTLIVIIFMQSRGTGFARSMGGSSSSFTRRGLEKIVFRATFVVFALFIIVSFISVAI